MKLEKFRNTDILNTAVSVKVVMSNDFDEN
jgi:hypothetical protein